jgi:hypothetical protein
MSAFGAGAEVSDNAQSPGDGSTSYLVSGAEAETRLRRRLAMKQYFYSKLARLCAISRYLELLHRRLSRRLILAAQPFMPPCLSLMKPFRFLALQSRAAAYCKALHEIQDGAPLRQRNASRGYAKEARTLLSHCRNPVISRAPR